MVKKTAAAKVAPKKADKTAAKPIKKAEKPPSPVVSKLRSKSGPKWDLSKLAMGQFLSMTSYFTVLNIGSMISIKNQHGHTMQASKCLLETMYSADHYEREVPLNMTALAELLQSVRDNIFTVEFRRQVTEQDAIDVISASSAADFKDAKKLSALAKQITTGSNCKMTCHMVQVENNLGRSLVIDLKTDSASKFR